MCNKNEFLLRLIDSKACENLYLEGIFYDDGLFVYNVVAENSQEKFKKNLKIKN
jgi:hypothetical protein